MQAFIQFFQVADFFLHDLVLSGFLLVRAFHGVTEFLLHNLIESSNEDITFSQNEDGSVSCYTKYKDYNIGIQITENEVFKYAIQRDRETAQAIAEIIQEKFVSELLK